MDERIEKGLWAFLIAGVTLAAYYPVASAGFAGLDDALYVTGNPVVRGGLGARGIAWAFTTFHAANWHPVTWLSHMLDVSLFGIVPASHHLVNVALHVANAILLYLLLVRMTGSARRSGLAAALFALHPLNVESVAWISERKELLSFLFGTLAAGAWVRWVGKPSVFRYLLVVLWFALGLMSKPMLVTLPFLLLLLDFWPLRRTGTVPVMRLLAEKAPLFLLSAASSMVTLLAQSRGTAIVSLSAVSFGMRAANAAASVGTYLRRAVWPSDLAVFYPHPATILGEPAPYAAAAASFSLIAVLGYISWRRRRESPYLATGLLWFLCALVPTIGLVQVGAQAMADRYAYLPMIGVFVAFSWGVAEMIRAAKPPAAVFPVVALGLLAACMGATRVQAGYWKNDLALFGRAVEAVPGNWLAHENVGVALAREGDVQGGIRHFLDALRIKPDYAEAHSDMAAALIDLGRPAEAAGWARRAIRLKPGLPEAHNTLGQAIDNSGGDRGEAAREYQEAIRLNPRYPEAYNNLGVLYGRKGDSVVAIRYFRDALRIDPGNVEAWINLGVAFRSLGMPADAERSFRCALSIDPGNPRARREIGSGGKP